MDRLNIFHNWLIGNWDLRTLYLLFVILIFFWLNWVQGSRVSPAVTAPVTGSVTDRRWTEPAGRARTPVSPPTSWPSTSPPWPPSPASSPGRRSSWSLTASGRDAAVGRSVSQPAVTGKVRGKFAGKFDLSVSLEYLVGVVGGVMWATADTSPRLAGAGSCYKLVITIATLTPARPESCQLCLSVLYSAPRRSCCAGSYCNEGVPWREEDLQTPELTSRAVQPVRAAARHLTISFIILLLRRTIWNKPENQVLFNLI